MHGPEMQMQYAVTAPVCLASAGPIDGGIRQ